MAHEFQGTARFQLLGQIGAGGFGEVFRARDKERGQLVALKVLSRLEPASLYRFKQEFRLFADLRHPNLVSLFELFSGDDVWFFTMELVEGVDWLSHVRGSAGGVPPTSIVSAHAPTQIQAPTPDTLPSPDLGEAPTVSSEAPVHGLDLTRLRASLRQLSGALASLHAAGVVHRDVKPSNVLVTPAGRVVLLDLGIARGAPDGAAALTDANVVLGTPAYMAPEQAISAQVGPPADWYSLGVMLFEALTARLPFDGSAIKVLTDKQRLEAPGVLSVCPGADRELAALCEGLLRCSAERRAGEAEVSRVLGHALLPPSSSEALRASVEGGEPGLIGRAAQLEQLAAAHTAASAGSQTIVLLHGASGIGKSTLATVFLEGLDPGTMVLQGRCYQRESIAFKAFDGIIDTLGRELRALPRDEAARVTPRDAAALSKLFPVLERVPAIAEAPRKVTALVDAHLLRQRAFSALRELLSRLADARPLVLFIDDVQWGDEDSARLLVELVTPPDPPSFLLVLTCRSDEMATSPLLASLRTMTTAAEVARATKTLEVGPLPADDARALVRSWLGPERGGHVDTVLAEAAGNPYFLRELARLEASPAQDHRRRAGMGALVEQRLSSLTPQARAVLEVVCVAGRPVKRSVVARATGSSTAEATEVVQGLRQAQMVRAHGQQGEDVEAYHDRIRETVAGMLGQAQLERIHREVALALIEDGEAEPEELFAHCRGAGMKSQAAAYAQAAAQAAAQALAFDHAAGFYREALSLGGLGPAELRKLHLEHGMTLANAGRGPAAAAEFLAALPGSSPTERVGLERRAAELLLSAGEFTEGMAALTLLLKQAGTSMPRAGWPALVTLLCLQLWLAIRGFGFRQRDASAIAPDQLLRLDVYQALAGGLAFIDPVMSQLFNSRQLLLALSVGEPTRTCVGWVVEASMVATRGVARSAQANRILLRAQEIVERNPSPENEQMLAMGRGMTHFFSGQWKSSSSSFERAMELQREHGVGSLSTNNLVALQSLFCRVQLGDLKGLCQHVAAIRQRARERGNLFLSVGLAFGELSWTELVADEPERARQGTADAMAAWRHTGHPMQEFGAKLSLFFADMYQGRFDAALKRHEQARAEVRRSLLRLVQTVDVVWVVLGARSALGVARPGGEAGALLSRAERGARYLDRTGARWGEASAALLHAGVAATRRDEDRAVAQLRRAIVLSQETDMALYTAVARWRLGARLGGDEGRALVEAGRGWLVEQGVRKPEAFATMLAPGFE
jgi:eukaryotic-like serine/threonine-protein kinase